MDISLVIGGLRGGGTERVCVTLANALAAKGHAVDLVVLGRGGDVRSADLSAAVRLIDLGVRHARNAFMALHRYLAGSGRRCVLSFNHQLTAVLVALRPFVPELRIMARSPNFASASQASKSGIWHRLIVDRLLRTLVRRADWHIAQSHGMAEDMVRYFRVPADRLTIVKNPLSPAFSQSRGAPAVRARTVLCVGRLVEQKGWDLALAAFAEFHRDHPDFMLQFVGTGPLEAQLQAMAARLGLEQAIRFEGFQTEIRPFYENASVTLLTSVYEGFPNVLLEAIACGCPVVAVDCPTGPAELIIDGINGFLVRSRKPGAVASRVSEACETAWDVSAMQDTIECYQPEVVAGHYEFLFGKMMLGQLDIDEEAGP